MTRLVLFELFVTNLLLSTNEKLLVSWQFSGAYDVTKYGSGWRKDVVNQCLEFAMPSVGRWWLSSTWGSFAPCVLMHITIAALPLARLCRFSISLQRCHLSDLLHWFQLQPCHLLDLLHCFQFRAGPLARLYFVGFSLQTLLHWFQFTAVPLVRLYCIGFSLQPCHWSDFIALVSVGSPDTCQTLFHGFSLQPCHLPDFITLVSVYNAATCKLYGIVSSLQPYHLLDFIALAYSPATRQTLLHWFQFAAGPLVRLYCTDSSLQPYHWSDFITLVWVGSCDACQTLIHYISLQSCRLSDFILLVSVGVLPLARFDLSRFSSYRVVWLCPLGPWPNAHYIAALPSARIYFTRSKVWPDRPEFTSLGPRCDLLIAIPNILLKPYKGTHQSDYYLALPELLYDQMPKTQPTRRSRHARASEGPPDDRTMLTRHAEELLASALSPAETARNQRHILDSDLHSLQAQQRQALDPNNKMYHITAGLPSSDHEGILVRARCYSRSFISVLPQRAC